MLSECNSVSPRSEVGSTSPVDCNRFVDDLVSMMVKAEDGRQGSTSLSLSTGSDASMDMLGNGFYEQAESEPMFSPAVSKPRQILGARQQQAPTPMGVDQNLMSQLETLPRDQLLGIFRNLFDESSVDFGAGANQGAGFGNKENMYCGYDMARDNDAYSAFNLSMPPPLDPSLPLIGPAEFVPNVPPPMPFATHGAQGMNNKRVGKGRNMFNVPPPPLPMSSAYKGGMRPNRHPVASTLLHAKLEECFGHLRELEKEHQQTEGELAFYFPDKGLNGFMSHVPVPRLPASPSRVDRLVVEALKEHAHVFTLLSRMEEVLLKGHSFNAAIAVGLKAWINAICKVQERRQEEMDSLRILGKADDNVVLALAESVGELSATLRRVRSCLWVALQIVMEKSDLPFRKAYMAEVADYVDMDKNVPSF